MYFDGLPICLLRQYRYLASGNVKAEGKDDASDFLKMIECLRKLKFSSDDLNGIMGIVAGILHLGNIEFDGAEKVHALRCITRQS